MFFVLFSFFLFAKEPISLQPETIIPDAPKKNELDLKPFKNIELNNEQKPADPNAVCTSHAGVQYKAGTESYNSCMQESNRYTPPGFDPSKKN